MDKQDSAKEEEEEEVDYDYDDQDEDDAGDGDDGMEFATENLHCWHVSYTRNIHGYNGLPVAGNLAPEDLYGDLYNEEGVSDELQSLNVFEVNIRIRKVLHCLLISEQKPLHDTV